MERVYDHKEVLECFHRDLNHFSPETAVDYLIDKKGYYEMDLFVGTRFYELDFEKEIEALCFDESNPEKSSRACERLLQHLGYVVDRRLLDSSWTAEKVITKAVEKRIFPESYLDEYRQGKTVEEIIGKPIDNTRPFVFTSDTYSNRIFSKILGLSS